MGIINPFHYCPTEYKKYILPNSARYRKRIDGSRPKSKRSRKGTAIDQ
jgi:hypothetical protein